MSDTRKKRKAPPAPEGPEYPIVFETFRHIGGYERGQLTQHEPSCWSNDVRVEKYRITIEKVEEPIEVIHERIRKLWAESDNHYHRAPIKATAARFGLVLDDGVFGKERKVSRG